MERRSFLFSAAAVAAGRERLPAPEVEARGLEGEALPGFRVLRQWRRDFCSLRLRNAGDRAVRLREALPFTLPLEMPGETRLYGEGYQMLSQTGGTLATPEQLGGYTDVKHYRLYQPEGALTLYNVVQLEPPGAAPLMAAFTSCRRFNGRYNFRTGSMEVSLDLDGIEVGAAETVELEEFYFQEGGRAGAQFERLAERLRRNHPPILGARPPEGWCSWYCFGPKVTAAQIKENLEFIARAMPSLRYIQIDDGYQPAMGDWLETGAAFGGDVGAVLKEIRARGFEPAIWVAPFIAEAGSRLFREHAEWFMKDGQGAPLPSNRVTFGGWRRGPWYALDGTHPGARAWLEATFRTMRREWGVTYFKLDANFWGTMPGARLYDAKATRVEAYRRGMEAVRRGAGDAFLLGCNHPLWPSLGLIHGSRSSNDVNRRWNAFRATARENLRRGWQNGRLWWNDPDCVLLGGGLTDEEFLFHITSITAGGGMLLSGDDMPRLSEARLALLRKMSPPTRKAAEFDAGLRVGRLKLPGRELIFLLNWADQEEDFTVEGVKGRVRNIWSGAEIAAAGGRVRMRLPAHGGRTLEAR